MERHLIPGDSPYDSLGFSRVVVVGSHVYVAGTAPIPKDGSDPPKGAYEQARLCLEIIGTALERAGASFEHVVRTRVYLADRSDMEEVSKAHAEVFSEIRPANTTVVTEMVDPAWKLEIDADALLLWVALLRTKEAYAGSLEAGLAGRVIKNVAWTLGPQTAKIRKVDPELAGLLNQAQNDPDAVALVLFGSAASGPTHEGSDLDVWYVRRGEPLPPRERRGRLEIVPTTLDLLRAAPDWLKSALAYAQTIWDETGEVESVLAAARTISHDETAELYDGYLNDFFRSMKAWRMGNELAGRIECGRSLRFLGELVFALDGIRAPYPKEWQDKLGELEPLILEVARTGAPHLQQELCVIVRDRAAQRGYAHVYDAWTGDIDRALSFDFV